MFKKTLSVGIISSFLLLNPTIALAYGYQDTDVEHIPSTKATKNESKKPCKQRLLKA